MREGREEEEGKRDNDDLCVAMVICAGMHANWVLEGGVEPLRPVQALDEFLETKYVCMSLSYAPRALTPPARL